MRHIKTLEKGFIKNILNQKENPVVIEIGAHYGEDTKEFLEEFSDIEIYCFEPDPRNIKVIKKYIGTDKINFFECAVSDSDDEEVEFFMAKKTAPPKVPKKYGWIDEEDYYGLGLNRSGASSLKKGHPAVENAEVTKVKTVKLDSWAADHNIEEVDFIWIDVQGAEKNVINGARELIKRTKFLYMEYGELGYNDAMSLDETTNLLKESGFSVYKVFKQGGKGDVLLKNDVLVLEEE